MFVDHNVISSAAQLIMDGIDGVAAPFADEESDWKGFDANEAKALREVLDEVNWSDLCLAVREAAKRVNARDDEDEEPAEAS